VLIDVTNSWAVLIGTASHTLESDLEDLPAVQNNLTDLAAALMDPDILGLPEDQIETFLDPTDASVVGDAILAAGEKASGALLVYYAGHGLPDEDGQLFFALSGTRSRDLPFHALPFQWVARGIRRSMAPARVLILDCCFAGLSQRPTMSGKDLVAEAVQSAIAGTWALFSSASDTPSVAPPGASHTAFTGALIDLVNSGIPGGPKDLDGGTVLEALRRRLVREGFPRPDQSNTDLGYQIAIARNRAYSPRLAVRPRGIGQASFAAADPLQLGATWNGSGTNFAVASRVADAITLCLFDEAGQETRIPLRDYDAGVWHRFVPGVGPGQAYGYRATGPYDPARGVRCNPAKLLLDPYARAISGEITFGPEVLDYVREDPDRPSALDSAGHMPRSVVVDDTDEWSDSTKPMRPYADTVIYEVHVKGFTMRHPDVPAELRGTYAGLAHEAAISYLVDLGVTAVELLPVHESAPQAYLQRRGLTNYWGYNTISYFAPHQGYSAEVRAGRPGGQVAEFKSMVDALHAAGIEVIVDVVYNYTAEGDQRGPTLCYRGLDNPTYYRLDPGDPSYYIDTTGVGNTLNFGNPQTLQMVMDSLRYWLTNMGVDGFRFNLALTLARHEHGFDEMSQFLTVVSQDPVVSRAKLIAEPWDVGQMDSYDLDLGRFPPLWREWNSKYRDTMRDFWRSQQIGIGEFATRLCGSPDLYRDERQGSTASVNFVTSHHGFTLRDLVSYNDKHNEANEEANRDGTDDNRSWNCGAEGPTDDPAVLSLRARQSRAMLTTLLLSFGVPTLLGGDEMGRTQQGNNNAYPQDNELTWFDWSSVDDDLLAYTRRLIAFRKEHPMFRRRRFLAGGNLAELNWFTPAGTPMTEGDWADPGALSLAVYLDGSDDPDWVGDTPLMDDDFLVFFNAWWEPLDFVIPATPGQTWQAEIDSYDPAAPAAAQRQAGDRITVGPRSVTVLRGPRPDSADAIAVERAATPHDSDRRDDPVRQTVPST
jgi:glycogen operon protein